MGIAATCLTVPDNHDPAQAILKGHNGVNKSNPTDSNCWEYLDDAYLSRGAHTSAL